MLLEALIAILIFSVGILGIVGMQASTIKASRDAKFRADAGLLANELIGQMWVGNRDGATLQTNFQGGHGCGASGTVLAVNATTGITCFLGAPFQATVDGPAYTAWVARMTATATLPGLAANPPFVVVVPGVVGPPQTSSTVSVIVRWQAPNEAPSALNPAGIVHSYSVVVQII
jgi:type IV pilus assembly protein PilV